MPSIKKQFDVIVMNPPYQAPQEREEKGRGRSGTTLWNVFVAKAFELARNDGHVCAVHPSGWREAFGTFDGIASLLREKQVEFLEVHDRNDGVKMFGAFTSYDWYVAKNCATNHQSVIRQMNGEKCEVDISSLPFVPNFDIKKIAKMFAKPGEKKCEILFSWSDYETRKEWMSEKETAKFKHPCVYTVSMNNEINLWWSEHKKNGHFGVPKVIFSNGTSGTICDSEGKYGLTQFSYAIVDEPQNLENIQKAITNPDFLKVMDACSLIGKHRYNRKAISCFRKDFWKDFI